MRRLPSAALILGVLLPTPLFAQEKVDFQRDIRPILSNKCFKCHGPATQEAGLRLDDRDRATRRKVIVPGKPADSKLIARVLLDDDERMPPPEVSEALKPAQVALLKKWIAEGAEYTPHYAFIKPKQAALPALKNQSWARNPIDFFILARLEKEGLRPSEEADRPTLIRRLSLDLLGLLPTPAEVKAFADDTSPDAYEKLVDRLFASPHYGERQARNWLDLARYADSNGYTIDGKRSIWPWRDWVITAYNKNLSFAQFTIEQLAGDLLPGATKDQIVATGFHRNTAFNEEGGANPEQFRVERTVDRTNTTGAVWLGLTVGCAQCHTHKYDPISHKEYYQLYAFFNSLDEPKINIPRPDMEDKLRALNAELAKAKKEQQTQPKNNEDLVKLLADLEKETNGGWRACYPKIMTAEQGAKLTGLEDRSILAGGEVGPTETSNIQSVAPESGLVTAVRLEALTDPSLPMKGPGRAKNGNFVLSQFGFDADGVNHPFRKAVADFSQAKYDVSEVLTGELNKGWAVGGNDPRERNVDREAIFFLERPLPVREGQAFEFMLRFSETPKAYPLGRFRISVTFASERVLELPVEAQKIVFMDPSRRVAQDMEQLEKTLVKAPVASKQAATLQKQIRGLEAQAASTLVVREAPKRRQTFIMKRGDFLDPGDAVEPGVLAILNPLPVNGRPANRLDLARWLVSPDNPLTARVVINRFWQHYFGKGLVETENDFGMQGSMPSHPELLDWLAVEFMNVGWDQKKMHRLIVTSATYRQSSKLTAEAKEKDPQNRLLARQHRLRLDAEIIRDAALSASGLLTPTIGGPGVYPPQPPEIFSFTQNKQAWPESKGPDRFRRGMYTFIWRQSQHPLLTTFDAPDAQTACTRRNRSNTPLQALHLANDPTFIEIAKGLAARITKDGPTDDAGRIAYGFELCCARAPGAGEQRLLEHYFEQQKQADAGQAWTMLARLLLNLDEFITRE
jgi:hypothetical protein